MYMGDRIEATPTATPPVMRAKTKINKLWAVALPIAERKNRIAASIKTFFRPKWSPAFPASITPAMHPNSRLLTVQPKPASDKPK
jgi:hypothetical protein